MSTDTPADLLEMALPPESRIGVVAARFNQQIVDELLSGCLDRLRELGIADDRVVTARVPGAFELPVAAKALLSSAGVDGVVCLGCVVRGDTPHFDYVAGEAARGIQLVAVQTGKPVIFGVLTTETFDQAQQRIDATGPHGHAGARAATAAVEMIALIHRLGGPRKS